MKGIWFIQVLGWGWGRLFSISTYFNFLQLPFQLPLSSVHFMNRKGLSQPPPQATIKEVGTFSLEEKILGGGQLSDTQSAVLTPNLVEFA